MDLLRNKGRFKGNNQTQQLKGFNSSATQWIRTVSETSILQSSRLPGMMKEVCIVENRNDSGNKAPE